MNPLQIYQRVQFYTDVTRNGRFTFAEIAIAVNDAILKFKDNLLGDMPNRNAQNFQWVQAVRDSLYTLIKTNNPTITNGTVVVGRYFSHTPSNLTLPADYEDFLMLQVTIDGITDYARPTTFNLLGPLLNDSFRHPTNEKTYYCETTSSYTLWRGTGGTFSSALLTYLKAPATFSIGSEDQLISAGGTLANAVNYYAVQVSVYNNVTYQIGATVSGTGTTLTSGQVIAVSNTTACDLPPKTHEEISRIAAGLLLGTTQQFNSSAYVKSEDELNA